MKKHLKYLRYVLRHKYYVAVFLLGDKFTLGHLYRAIVHDFSKFKPSEWFPYVQFFNGYKSKLSKEEIESQERVERNLGLTIKTRAEEKAEFDVAWLHHQKRNKHHWQYWLLTYDKGNTVALEMPFKYIQEMIADWKSAGYCITGKLEVKEWYRKNRDQMIMHPETRRQVDWILLAIMSPYVEEFLKP